MRLYVLQISEELLEEVFLSKTLNQLRGSGVSNNLCRTFIESIEWVSYLNNLKVLIKTIFHGKTKILFPILPLTIVFDFSTIGFVLLPLRRGWLYRNVMVRRACSIMHGLKVVLLYVLGTNFYSFASKHYGLIYMWFVFCDRFRVCQGLYDADLIRAWEDWDRKHNSENDHPKEFPEQQVSCFTVLIMDLCVFLI